MAHVVDDLGGQGLAGAGLAQDQGHGVGMRGLDNVLAHAVQQQALTHEAAVGLALQALGAELVGHGLHFQVGELFLKALQLRDVADDRDHAPDLAVFVKHRRTGVQTAFAVGVIVKKGHGMPGLQGPQGHTGFEAPLLQGLGHMPAHHLFGLDPGNALHGPVDAPGDAVGVNDPDAVVNEFQHAVQFAPGQPGGLIQLAHGNFIHGETAYRAVAFAHVPPPVEQIAGAARMAENHPALLAGRALRAPGLVKAFQNALAQPAAQGRAGQNLAPDAEHVPQSVVGVEQKPVVRAAYAARHARQTVFQRRAIG